VLQIVQGGILSTSETAKTKVKKVKKVTGNGLLVSNKCYGKGNPERLRTSKTLHKSKLLSWNLGIRRAQGSKISRVAFFLGGLLKGTLMYPPVCF
jgi:hypothetical protein